MTCEYFVVMGFMLANFQSSWNLQVHLQSDKNTQSLNAQTCPHDVYDGWYNSATCEKLASKSVILCGTWPTLNISKCLDNLFLVVERTNGIGVCGRVSDLPWRTHDQFCCGRVMFKKYHRVIWLVLAIYLCCLQGCLHKIL